MSDELTNVDPFLETIREQLQAAQDHLALVCQEMVRLEGAGMYPSVPHEQWQTRNGGEARYLYMLFRAGRDGEYLGPDGKRKVYVGCDQDKITEARRLKKNRLVYDRLERLSDNLHHWITREVFAVRHLADQTRHWPNDEMLLGRPGAGQEEPGGPNDLEEDWEETDA